jgi:hypothetical protein
MSEVAYYLVALLIPLVVFLIVSRRSRRWYVTVFYGTNISMLVLLIYFVALGVYFKSFYMGHFDVYPSLHISQWWMRALLFLVLPLDLVFSFLYLRKKMYDRKT